MAQMSAHAIRLKNFRTVLTGGGGLFLFLLLLAPVSLQAADGEAPQVPPAPVITVGGVIYGQYLYDLGAKANDMNGFDVTRAYINVKADLPEDLRARITPDIVRETSTTTTISGNLVFRLKYAYLEKDNPTTTGSWVRFGLHQTPWLDFEESINRYRFQGSMFAEKEGMIPGSADFGLGYFQPFPEGFGELAASGVNGEGYKSAETNKYKSGQVRATLRPAPSVDGVKGLRISGFYEYGEYALNQLKQLGIGMVSYEQQYLVVTAQYLKSHYKSGTSLFRGDGYSAFAEIRFPYGWTLMGRVDRFDPNLDKGLDAHTRQIYGVGYWTTWKGGNIGILLNNEQVSYEANKKPYEEKVLVNTQLVF